MVDGGAMIDAALHWLGYGLCHQIPERSFFGGGHQLPVCARDTGIYLGFVVALLVMALLDRGRRRAGMPPAWLLGVGFAALVALGWDGITSYAGLRVTTNVIRLATGTGTGFAIALVIGPLLNTQMWRHRSEERVLGSPIEGLVWCAAAPVTFAVTLWGAPLVGTAYPLAVAAAVLVTFTAVNLVLVSLVPHFERTFDRLRDAWPALLWAFALSLVEFALADWARLALLSLIKQV
jgi:uncharacterized membrane protein